MSPTSVDESASRQEVSGQTQVPPIQEYVVGLLFDEEGDQVVLIHKRHGPKCVVGRWNGVGGKVEPGEDPKRAMVREFLEETGVRTRRQNWTKFCELVSGVAYVHFYVCKNDHYLQDVTTTTDEQVEIFDVNQLSRIDTPVNLTWLIPWLLDPLIVHDLLAVRMNKDQEI